MSNPTNILHAIDTLPTSNLTVHMLRALDFVVPGEWNNITSYDEMLRSATGQTDGYVLWHIRERSLELYNDLSQGYQRTVWLYRTMDRADSALGAAALANRVGNKFSMLSFLSKLTPRPDTAQAIDISLKLAVEFLAFCQLNQVSFSSLGNFANALQHYRHESLMRMAALVCIDGIIPFGADFTSIVLEKLRQLNANDLEQNSTFRPLSSVIPGDSPDGQLGFLTQSFEAVQGWIDGFLGARGLSRELVLEKMKQFVDVADSKLDYVAAFFDIATNYYEHTGVQTVARSLAMRAAAEVLAHPPNPILADSAAPMPTYPTPYGDAIPPAPPPPPVYVPQPTAPATPPASPGASLFDRYTQSTPPAPAAAAPTPSPPPTPPGISLFQTYTTPQPAPAPAPEATPATPGSSLFQKYGPRKPPNTDDG